MKMSWTRESIDVAYEDEIDISISSLQKDYPWMGFGQAGDLIDRVRLDANNMREARLIDLFNRTGERRNDG